MHIDTNTVLLVVLVLSVLLVAFGVANSKTQCATEKVVYKYVPHGYFDNDPWAVDQFPSDIFRVMFEDQSPWIISRSSFDANKVRTSQQFFESQLEQQRINHVAE